MCKNMADKAENEDYRELCQQGLVLIQSKSSKAALSYLEKALKIQPNCHEAWYYQGLALHTLGCYEKAITSYNKALQIQPNYSEAWCERAYTLSILGDYEEAIVSYYKALEIDPNSQETEQKRATTLQDFNLSKDGFKCPEAPLELQIECCYVFGYIQDDNHSEFRHCEAEIASYDSEIDRDIGQYKLRNLWFRRSDVLMRLGYYEQAISSYDTALGILEGQGLDYCRFRGVIPKALYNQSVALHHLRHNKEAIKKYDEAIKKDRRYPLPLYGRGLSLVNLGQIEAAIASFDKALEIKPCYTAVWYTKGTLLEKLECFLEAITCYQKALDISRAFSNQEIEMLALERMRTLQDNSCRLG
jgi:tetratricopeptide (TPR) repeat protein